VLKKATIVACLAIGLLVGWIALRWKAPPLRIVQRGNDIVVDVQTLGEYPTTVNRIRLSDLNHSSVVWEIAAANGTPQIDRFMLKAAENPATLEANFGTYRIVAPTSGIGFLLRKGSKYKIELWGGTTVFTKRSAIVQLAN
jgi:hypothetical protein